MNTIDVVSIITIALLGSFGHCVGMCGGIVVAYSATKISGTSAKLRQGLSHLLYSLGRVSTYTLLGAVFGALGSVATLSHTANGVLYLIAAVFMLLVGLDLFGKINILNILEHSVHKAAWYKAAFGYLIKSDSPASFFMLGMLNGLLPCGFVYLFAITAASTANFLSGALVMMIFGLATTPAMFSLGFFVGFLKNRSFRATLLKVASISVILYAFFMIFKGVRFLMAEGSGFMHCCH
ncbi:MAG: sulfite exporter TauE/SafE family protein [Helicobacteraceae bacterium]